MSWHPPDGPPTTPPTTPPTMPPPGAEPEPGAEGPRRRSSSSVVVAAVVAVALVLGAAAGLVLLLGGDEPDRRGAARSPGEGSSSPTSAPGDPAAPDELDQVVAQLSAFVAEARGLEFLRSVEVELLDGQPFRDRLFEDAEEDREELEATGRVLRAMQLIGDDVDLFEVVLSFLGDSVVGFYDPETDELVLRGAALSPYVRATLVHELVHALDDQHFELDRDELEDADDESSLAFSALVEGNAVRVQEAYEATLSAEERRRLGEEQGAIAGGIDLAGVPPVVAQLIVFPYLAGPDFVRALLDVGGEEVVNDAFGDPPTTSEQIAEPDDYLGEEPVLSVAAPQAGGEIVDQGAYGYWALLLTLADKIDLGDAQAAAAGWGGDHYVAWDEGDRTCVRAAFAMDTAGDLDELVEAWQAWADGHGDADVAEGDDDVTVTACG